MPHPTQVELERDVGPRTKRLREHESDADLRLHVTIIVVKKLADIHGRIPEMDEHGIEHMIMSLTSPGPQGRANKADAEDLAKRANDVSRGITLVVSAAIG